MRQNDRKKETKQKRKKIDNKKVEKKKEKKETHERKRNREERGWQRFYTFLVLKISHHLITNYFIDYQNVFLNKSLVTYT